jgi:hypothetical protein
MALIILCNPLDELVYGASGFLDALYQPENFGMAILANETSKRTTVVLKSLVLCKEVVLLLAIAFGIWHE